MAETFYGNTTDIKRAKKINPKGNYVNVENMSKEDRNKISGGVALGGIEAEGGFGEGRAKALGLTRIAGANREETASKFKDYFQETQPKVQNVQKQGPSFVDKQQQLIDQQYNQRQQAELEAIKRARDTALQGLNKGETQTQEQAYDMRNQSDVVSNQNAKRLREMMAEQGLLASGDNITAMSQLNAQRQGSLGDIDRQESAILNDILEKRNLINSQAAEQDAGVISGIEADKLRQLRDLAMYGDQRSYQRERDQIGDDRYDEQFGYQQERDDVADNRYDEQFGYQQERDQVGDNRYDEQFGYQQERDDVADNRYDEQFAYQQARDEIQDERWQTQFDEDMRRFGLQHALQRQVQLGQLSVQQANAATSRARLNYQKEQDALAKQEQEDQLTEEEEEADEIDSAIMNYIIETDMPQEGVNVNSATEVSEYLSGQMEDGNITLDQRNQIMAKVSRRVGTRSNVGVPSSPSSNSSIFRQTPVRSPIDPLTGGINNIGNFNR